MIGVGRKVKLKGGVCKKHHPKDEEKQQYFENFHYVPRIFDVNTLPRVFPDSRELFIPVKG